MRCPRALSLSEVPAHNSRMRILILATTLFLWACDPGGTDAPPVPEAVFVDATQSAGVDFVHDNGADGIDGRPVTYQLLPAGEVPDLALRSAPLPRALGGGRRSLYGPDGLVDGTERLERFLLWPMGIASPGATRQWGHHATAFVGRRHFDDVDLFERAFRR